MSFWEHGVGQNIAWFGYRVLYDNDDDILLDEHMGWEGGEKFKTLTGKFSKNLLTKKYLQ